MPLDPVTGFSIQNAQYFANASKAAYLDAEADIAQLLETDAAAVTRFTAIGPLNDTEGFVARLPGAVILAFRGTEPKKLKDWTSDLHSTPTRMNWLFPNVPPVGEIHAGFGHALADAWDEITQLLKPAMEPADGSPSPKLFITGHSLGGALAVLAAAVCSLDSRSLYKVNGLYTYGQPRVATHEAANTFSRLLDAVHFRFVNYSDIVPRVPLRTFDYTHTGQMIHFAPPLGLPMAVAAEQGSFFGRAFTDLKSVHEFFHDAKPEIEFHLLDSKTGYLASFLAYVAALEKDASLAFRL